MNKNTIKFLITILITMSFCFTIFVVDSYAISTFNVNVNETIDLEISNIHYEDAIWEIEDGTVAKIKSTGKSMMKIGSYINASYSAKIEGGKKGTTTLKLKTSSGQVLATATINVTKEIRNIKFKNNKIEIEKDSEYKLTPILEPENPDDIESLIWESSNPEVATVNENGVINAKQVGTTNITLKNESYSGNIEIEVVIKLKSIKLDKNELEIIKGSSNKLSVEYLPDNTTDVKDVIWNSSNNSIVKVDSNGNVEAIDNGKATITATVGEFASECEITVLSPLKSIEFENNVQYGFVGNKIKMQDLIYNPIDTTDDKKIIWSCENNEIAAINEDNTISCLKEGNTKIIANVGELAAEYDLIIRKYQLGDVNKDGKINAQDATLILKYVAKKATLTDEQLLLADTDKDGKIKASDAVRILKYVAKKISEI